MTFTNAPIALITGSARRIGATTCQTLHAQGYTILIHCRNSTQEATALAESLNAIRANSAHVFQADLCDMAQVEQLCSQLNGELPMLNLLVNNASSFYPTPAAESTQAQWDDLINSNVRAAYFLSTGLLPLLRKAKGSIVNIVDIHAQRGLPGYPIYSIAKAGLEMMTKTLAKDLAPEVRVNGISPGPILWPEAEAALSEAAKQEILIKTPLARSGAPDDIAQAVCFMASAGFVTGQVLAVDGGRSLYS